VQGLATEAVLWRHLVHPNIVRFVGIAYGWHEAPLGLVSEWMPNSTVREFLQMHPEPGLRDNFVRNAFCWWARPLMRFRSSTSSPACVIFTSSNSRTAT
jgi:hypothetical protein